MSVVELTEPPAAPLQRQAQHDAPNLEDWPTELYSQSPEERYALYNSIAARRHAIDIAGPDNMGVFAGLFRKYPLMKREVEGRWYRMQKVALGLCRSEHNGIVNTRTTTYKLYQNRFGPGCSRKVTEWWVRNLFDLWQKRLLLGEAGKDPFLSGLLSRRHTGRQPLPIISARVRLLPAADPQPNTPSPGRGTVLQSIETNDNQIASEIPRPDEEAAQTIFSDFVIMPQDEEEPTSGPSESSQGDRSNSSNDPAKHVPGPSARRRSQVASSERRMQMPVNNPSNQPNDQTRPTISVPSGNIPSQGVAQIKTVRPSDIRSSVVTELTEEVSMPPRNGNHTNLLNGQTRQASVSQQNGLGQEVGQVQNGMEAPFNNYGSNEKNNRTRQPSVTLGSFHSAATQMQNGTPQQFSTPSNNPNDQMTHQVITSGNGIQVKRSNQMNVRTVQALSPRNGLSPPAHQTYGIQSPATYSLPCVTPQNNLSEHSSGNREDPVLASVEGKYSVMVQRYLLSAQSKQVLKDHYKRLYRAICSQNNELAHAIQAEIDCFVQRQQLRQPAAQQSNGFLQTSHPAENGLKIPARNGTPSMPAHNGASPQETTSKAKTELLAKLRVDLAARILQLSLDEADQKALGEFYEAFFRAYCDGDNARARAAKTAIEFFRKRTQQLIKSIRESVATSVAVPGGQNGFEAPIFSSNYELSGQLMLGPYIQQGNRSNQMSNQVGPVFVTSINSPHQPNREAKMGAPMQQSNSPSQMNLEVMQASPPAFNGFVPQNGQAVMGVPMLHRSQSNQMSNHVREAILSEYNGFAEQYSQESTNITVDGNNGADLNNRKETPDKYLPTHNISFPMRGDRPRPPFANRGKSYPASPELEEKPAYCPTFTRS